MVHYRYDKNTPAVKVILKGDGARGSYENVLVKGMSIQSLRDIIIPALTEFVGVTVEPMLSTVTKRFISKKIQELGSIDKVEAFYNKDDTASRFAKQEAERLLT